MPSFDDLLTNTEIDAIAEHVRTLIEKLQIEIGQISEDEFNRFRSITLLSKSVLPV